MKDFTPLGARSLNGGRTRPLTAHAKKTVVGLLGGPVRFHAAIISGQKIMTMRLPGSRYRSPVVTLGHAEVRSETRVELRQTEFFFPCQEWAGVSLAETYDLPLCPARLAASEGFASESDLIDYFRPYFKNGQTSLMLNALTWENFIAAPKP